MQAASLSVLSRPFACLLTKNAPKTLLTSPASPHLLSARSGCAGRCSSSTSLARARWRPTGWACCAPRCATWRRCPPHPGSCSAPTTGGQRAGLQLWQGRRGGQRYSDGRTAAQGRSTAAVVPAEQGGMLSFSKRTVPHACASSPDAHCLYHLCPLQRGVAAALPAAQPAAGVPDHAGAG